MDINRRNCLAIGAASLLGCKKPSHEDKGVDSSATVASLPADEPTFSSTPSPSPSPPNSSSPTDPNCQYQINLQQLPKLNPKYTPEYRAYRGPHHTFLALEIKPKPQTSWLQLILLDTNGSPLSQRYLADLPQNDNGIQVFFEFDLKPGPLNLAIGDINYFYIHELNIEYTTTFNQLPAYSANYTAKTQVKSWQKSPLMQPYFPTYTPKDPKPGSRFQADTWTVYAPQKEYTDCTITDPLQRVISKHGERFEQPVAHPICLAYQLVNRSFYILSFLRFT